MKNVLVAGAGGFIGGHLVKYLVSQGRRVRAVDIKPLNQWEQVSSEATNFAAWDLSNHNTCMLVTHDIEAVYNLAANMGGIEFIETARIPCLRNVLINTHLIEAARRNYVSKYFFASSACVYPDYHQLSIDIASASLKESDVYPAMPERGYGWEKLYSELVCREYEREDMAVYIARFHNVYGPYGTWRGGREKAPAAICRKVLECEAALSDVIQIIGDGLQTRSFMYISDCIEGISRIVNCDGLRGTPVNLGSSEMVDINTLVDIAESFENLKFPRVHVKGAVGVRGRNSDNAFIREMLDWEPTTPLSVGLRDTYDWIKNEIRFNQRKN